MIKINSGKLAKLYNDRIAWLMQQKQFGRRCRFIYPSHKRECDNCYQTTSGMSAGTYRPGGAEFFEGTTCPVCLGKGTFEEVVTEEDILIVLFDHRMWFEPANVSKLPDNSVMIIGDRLRTWNKVKKSIKIILDLDVYGDETPYVKSGEMYPVGLFAGDDKSGSRWFFAYLSREGGI